MESRKKKIKMKKNEVININKKEKTERAKGKRRNMKYKYEKGERKWKGVEERLIGKDKRDEETDAREKQKKTKN